MSPELINEIINISINKINTLSNDIFSIGIILIKSIKKCS